MIDKRKEFLGIRTKKYNHISDEMADKIKSLVEEGKTNSEIFAIVGIRRTESLAMFMSSYRNYQRRKKALENLKNMSNSEKTSSTIESIASKDVKK